VAAPGPYTSVTGTFTVPALTSAATCNEEMSEWVGIDGNSDANLIQAGIGEAMVNPGTGRCSGGYFIWAWWEILPAASVLVPITVGAGDRVTVTIAQISGSNWQIQLTDDTNAQAFTRDESYTAPLSSAEWVVEAPEDRSVCGGACDLSPYSPAVTFSGAGCTGGVSQLYDYTMIQGGVDVATPSAVPGWPSVFSIGYSSGGTNSRIARALRAAKARTGKLSHLVFEG
jgi:hypothetical protein